MGFLSSFFGFGGSQPRTQQVVQTSKLPEEISPYAKEILQEAQDLYKAQMDPATGGYDPYTEETIAGFTQEQQDAMAGLSGLVGTGTGLQEEALGLFRKGDERFTDLTPEQMQTYMSPYQRAVTDIEKREAQKVFESQMMPEFEKQAVSAGGMSGMGSRAGVQAAQLGQAQMQQMGDIESRGLQSAYQDARNLFQQQQAAQRASGQDIAKLAPAMFAQGLGEYGALQQVGEQKQAMEQEGLDEAYFKWLEEKAYPSEKLAEYSGFVYGNPLMQERTRTTTSPAMMGASPGAQLLNLGMSAASMYGMGGGFGNKPGGFSWGNVFPAAKGASGGGLSSLPVVYKQGGSNFLDTLEKIRAEAAKDIPEDYPTAAQYKLAEEKRAADVAAQQALATSGRSTALAKNIARLGDVRAAGKEAIRENVGADPYLALLRAGREAVRPSDIAGYQRPLGEVLGSTAREFGIDLRQQQAAAAKEESRIEEKMLPGEIEDIKTQIAGETTISEDTYKTAMAAINKRHDVAAAARKIPAEKLKLILANFKTIAGLYAAILKASGDESYAEGLSEKNLREHFHSRLENIPSSTMTGARMSKLISEAQDILSEYTPPTKVRKGKGSMQAWERRILNQPENKKRLQITWDTYRARNRQDGASTRVPLDSSTSKKGFDPTVPLWPKQKGGSIEEDLLEVDDLAAASDVLSDVEWLNT